MVTFGDFLAYFFEPFFRHLLGGAFGRLLGPKGAKRELSRAAGLAFGQCLAVFREGRPFSRKVASETPPGGHFVDFGAILEPFLTPFWLILVTFCPPILHAIFQCHFGEVREGGAAARAEAPETLSQTWQGLGKGFSTPSANGAAD